MLPYFKIRSLAKNKIFTSLSISFIFILSFLLIFFNKADYLLVNQIKSVSNEYVNPITKFVSLPVTMTSNLVAEINKFENG